MVRTLVRRWCLIVCATLGASGAWAQFEDSCFTSLSPGTSFGSSSDLGGFDADLLEWNGSDWIGDWPNATINLPPPSGAVGCRVIFMGNAVSWTSGGEGFGLRLTAPLVAGQTYSLTFNYVSHGFGSDGAFTFDIHSNNAPMLGGADFITTSPAVGYAWTMNTISFTAAAASAGDQWIVIHNGTAGTSGLISSFCTICSDFPTPCPPVSLGNDPQFCSGETWLLTANVPDGGYLWSDGSTDDELLVSTTGTFWVQVTTPDCIGSDTVDVTVLPSPDPDLPADLTLCEEDSLLLDATTPSASYVWNTGATTAAIWAHPPGTFIVEVSIGPCAASDSVTIGAVVCITGVEMPNVFSPNGDGLNETFSPLLFEGMASGSLTIHNRWGNLLETVPLPAGWNGRHNGSICPAGTYFWTMTARPLLGQEVHDHGSVTLVR